MRYAQRNARFEHIFVLVRLPSERPITDEQDVYLTKAFWTEEEAQQEAQRMNAQNAPHWRYGVHVARVVPGPTPEV